MVKLWLGLEISMPGLRHYKEYNQNGVSQRDILKAEAILWFHLRARKLNGYIFHRHYSLRKNVVNFYCPQLQLAIEIDGSRHFQPVNKANDRGREGLIQSHRIKVIKFLSYDILNYLDEVLKTLGEIVDERGRLLDHPTSD